MGIIPPQTVQLRRFLLEKIVNKYYQFLLQEPIPAMDNTGIWNSGSVDRDLTWIPPQPAAGSRHVHVSETEEKRVCCLPRRDGPGGRDLCVLRVLASQDTAKW